MKNIWLSGMIAGLLLFSACSASEKKEEETSGGRFYSIAF